MKKLNQLVAASVILTSLCTPVSVFAATNSSTQNSSSSTGSSFTDLTQSATWAQDAIVKGKALGLFVGDGNGKFHPLNTITRQEIATIVARVLKLDTPNTTTSAFPDVTSKQWGLPSIEAVRKAGIMIGDSNGKFRPDAPISREEMAAVLVKAVKGDTTGKRANLKVADKNSIQDWAKDYVQTAIEMGLMQGDGTNFYPNQLATRQEVAVVAVKLAKPTPVTLTGTDAQQYVQAQDFAYALNSWTDSNGPQNGYNVGFKLNLTKFPSYQGIKQIKVSLLDANGNVVATKTADNQARIDKLKEDDTTNSGELSALFVDTTEYGKTVDDWFVYSPYHLEKPAKAQIEVTDNNGNVYSVENNNLTGTTVTGTDAQQYVQAQDFAYAPNSWTDSNGPQNGYNVGFKLNLTKFPSYQGIKQIKVSLLDANGNVLATKTADTQARIDKLKADDTTNSGELSALFVDTTEYGKTADDWYVYSEYHLEKPAKAQIEITDNNGIVYSVENDNLTGAAQN